MRRSGRPGLTALTKPDVSIFCRKAYVTAPHHSRKQWKWPVVGPTRERRRFSSWKGTTPFIESARHGAIGRSRRRRPDAHAFANGGDVAIGDAALPLTAPPNAPVIGSVSIRFSHRSRRRDVRSRPRYRRRSGRRSPGSAYVVGVAALNGGHEDRVQRHQPVRHPNGCGRCPPAVPGAAGPDACELAPASSTTPPSARTSRNLQVGLIAPQRLRTSDARVSATAGGERIGHPVTGQTLTPPGRQRPVVPPTAAATGELGMPAGHRLEIARAQATAWRRSPD